MLSKDVPQNKIYMQNELKSCMKDYVLGYRCI